MTQDTRAADWLGRSGASVKTRRFQCGIHSLSLECLRPWFLQYLTRFFSHCILTSKAKWMYDIISESRKSNSL